MKVTVSHGDTTIQVDGKTTLKEAKRFILDIFANVPELEEVEEPTQPVGFSVTAQLERATEVEQSLEDDSDEW